VAGDFFALFFLLPVFCLPADFFFTEVFLPDFLLAFFDGMSFSYHELFTTAR